MNRNSRRETTRSASRRPATAALYWSVRGEYYSNEAKVVNTGSFKLSVARQYYKLTSQQKGDKIVYHLDKLAGAGGGRRHAGGAHHRRRQ